MPRISSIFEGFIPPPTPGASLTQYEHRQKPQVKAGKEKRSDELQLQITLATAADKSAGEVGDLSERHDATDDTRLSSRQSIDEGPSLELEDEAEEPKDEGSSSEVEQVDMSSKDVVPFETTDHVGGSKTQDTAPNKSPVMKQKRDRPSKDNIGDVQQAQPQKKRRFEADTTDNDAGEVEAHLDDIFARQEDGRDTRGERGDTEAISSSSGAKKGRGRPRKSDAEETKITTVADAEKKRRGRPRKVVDFSDPGPDLSNPKKDRPRGIEVQVSSHENLDLSIGGVQKRGRGRPRKPIDPNAPVPDPNAPKRGRGRPRKIIDPNAPRPDPDVPKKGRGRPRKIIDPNAPPPNQDTPKRGRGRPRKTVDPETAAQEAHNDTSKVGRGRPRKTEDSGARVSQVAPEAKTGTRGPGRPSEAKNVTSKQSEVDDGDSEDSLRVE